MTKKLDQGSTISSPSRRDLLQRTALAGVASSGTAASVAHAARLPVPESNKAMGEPMPEEAYGMPISAPSRMRREARAVRPIFSLGR
jgi:sulfane dehydrogenase subunit SoxC